MCDSPEVCAARQERLVNSAAALGLLARQDLAAAEVVAAVLEAPQLFDLMRGLMQQVLSKFLAKIDLSSYAHSRGTWALSANGASR